MSQEEKTSQEDQITAKQMMGEIRNLTKMLGSQNQNMISLEQKFNEFSKPKTEAKTEVSIPVPEVSHYGGMLTCKDCNKELKTALKKNELVECTNEECGAIVKRSENCPFCGGHSGKLI